LKSGKLLAVAQKFGLGLGAFTAAGIGFGRYYFQDLPEKKLEGKGGSLK